MFGVLLKKKGNNSEAREVLIEALNKMPLLHSAWLELSTLIEKKSARKSVFDKLKNHWIKNFFISSYLLDIQQGNDALDINRQLFHYFPMNTHILSQISNSFYTSQNYE